jgi:Tol biopolymer transport system component/DNA-binding winged helix-turn-helix (wHTH) protein
MAIPNPLPPRLAFGPYELNASTGELLKDGIRLRLPGQAFSILLLLLKHPGEVVTREQLREQIWREGTFVDFEHGLNAAMNKLRRALSDSAESPRYIETLPGRGYRFIGTLNSCPAGPIPILPKPDAAECRLPPPPQPQRVAVWERLIWAAGALLCLFIGQQFHQVPAAPPPWTLTRVTADIGLSNFPALSPDGNLMAYSSDQGPNGEQDLFVRQVATGPAIRLTFDGAGNTAPDFSPDGARIVFQSSRNGGGIYEISALGGKARLLARSGLNPRYSPDGSQVAYWVGAAGVNAAVPENGALWVVPVNGGAPRRVAPSFPAARQPIWLPDGKRLLFTGYTSSRAYETSALDWWTVATDGSSVVRAGVYEALARADLVPKVSIERPVLRLPTFPVPGCWSPTANTVVFSFRAKDQTDLWKIEVSPQTGKVTGPAKRLTTDTLRAADPSCTTGGAVAFTSVDTKTDVWSVAFDLDHGKPKGTLERVTMGPSSREHASLATNGHFVAFASNQSGRPNIWVRDLVTGDESPVASSSLEQHYPVMNAAGDKIAFSAFEKDSRTIYVSAPGGPPEWLC